MSELLSFLFMSNEITRFLTFGIIGVVNSGFDILIWHFLVGFCNRNTALSNFIKSIKLNNYSFSHTISFIITVISSYTLNRTFTFGDSSKQDNFQIEKFFAVATVSWLITTLFLNHLTSNKKIASFVDILATFEQSITNKESLISKHWPTVAKVLTIGVSMITNYVGYKIFVF